MSYGPGDLQRDLALPRETCARLETHRRLLEVWSKQINLIGPRELEDYWRRHALDCGQLVAVSNGARRWIDMGAGAGFPGLVVACMLADAPSPDARSPARALSPGAPATVTLVTLVETNAKKVAFLREAIRETGAPAQVLDASIDDVAPLPARYDVVTARAFAPLPRIIKAAKPILDRGAMGLFLKGAEFRAELEAAAEQGWTLRVEALASLSDPDGRILRIEGVTRAGQSG